MRLYTRNGYHFAGRFPQIVEAVSKLKVRSCFIDGEAIVVDERGLSAFDQLRSWRYDHAAVLCALLQVDGLIMPGFVELCTPHFVYALVIGAAEGHGRPKPNVEIAEIFKSSY